MIVVASWLAEYLAKQVSPQKMAEAMELCGIEVESLNHTPVFDTKIVVAEILQIKKHPNADKLNIITIYTGSQKVQLVSGAPGLETGHKVAYAPTGATLPGGMVMKEITIRGISSPGMILSAKELSLGDDESTILELDRDLKTGTPLYKVFSEETIIDIHPPANRPDLGGLHSIAREVSAKLGITNKVSNKTAELDNKKPTHFINQAKDSVPRYAIAKIEMPNAQPQTPAHIKQRLQLSGIRPINLVVDITNYVMLETAQPLHAFNAAKVRGKVVIRKAKAGEKITTLDGTGRKLTNNDLVIADSQKAIAIAGVIGGSSCEVSNKTKSILLESANFDGATIRKTAIRHGLRTEASSRFEKNLPVQLTAVALNAALTLFKEYADAKVQWIEDELNIWPWVTHIGVRPSKLSKLAGIKITEKQVVDSLRALGFAAEPFDIVKEAKKHLGKPYVWGASFKTHGTEAFDCGYLIDYIFSLIGIQVGHTAPQQYDFGRPIEIDELRPGDILFRDGEWVRLNKKERNGISHDVIYIGDGKILHAKDYDRDEKGKWVKLSKENAKVLIEPLEKITKDPDYIGARRLVEDLSGWIAVTVPWWRTDVKTEQDVFEEIIKLIGLEKLPETLPRFAPSEFKPDLQTPFIWNLRDILTGLGLAEVVTYPFVSELLLKELKIQTNNHLKLKNPRSLEQAYLRRQLLPNLFIAAANNTRRQGNFGFYEIARVYRPTENSHLADESNHLGIILQSPKDSYKNLKSILDNLFSALGVEASTTPTNLHNYLHPKRGADINIDGGLAGHLGEIDPMILRKFKTQGILCYLELKVDMLFKAYTPKQFQPISRFQPITRDITFVLPIKVLWADIERALIGADIKDVIFASDYITQGTGDTKSVTLKIKLSNLERAPTVAEAAQLEDKIKRILSRRFGAKLKE